MDFNQLLSGYKTKACVVSVEFYSDGGYGNIRVVAGNQAHCDDLASRHLQFVPGSPYETCFPKNQNFEDYCYRCTRYGKPLHAYVDLYMMGLWLNMILIPLDSDQENVGYCIYCYEVEPKASSDAMSNLSAETATKVLNTCIKLRGSDDIKQTFQEVVEDVREICGSDQCCILLTDSEKYTCSVFAESLRQGTYLPTMRKYVDGFYAITATWPKTLAGSTCIIVKDEQDMEKLREQNSVWAATLDYARIKSIVLFPLRHGRDLLGYMWAINFNVNDVQKIKEALEVTTFIVASEIASYKLMNKLEIMGKVDSLTGVMNRNEMNNRVDRINNEQEPMPKAVIFADLNGLKRKNDEMGHSAGDQMLRSAASILQSVFQDGIVYRAGGDEFMIIVSDIMKEDLQRRIARIHYLAGMSKDLCLSIGFSYDERSICTAMRLADERMYANKKAYYEAHPELKYR